LDESNTYGHGACNNDEIDAYGDGMYVLHGYGEHLSGEHGDGYQLYAHNNDPRDYDYAWFLPWNSYHDDAHFSYSFLNDNLFYHDVYGFYDLLNASNSSFYHADASHRDEICSVLKLVILKI